jgi:type II secretory pathway pseudopilin PulG
MMRIYQGSRRLRERGYALLGLIIALMVMAVTLTVAVPGAKVQARRQLEIEMFARGEHMAEAIARYYSQGNLPPAGLIVKTPPPPQGYLLELKKLRDGVTIGVNEVYFCRASAYIDPITDDEWEPIRIGDPRLRKFFRTWQQSTGRQLPPIYATYIGGGAIVDTTERPPEDGTGAGDEDDDEELDDEEFDEDEDEDEDEDDEDYEDDEDDEDDGDDEDDEDELRSKPVMPGAALFLAIAYQSTTQPETGAGPPTRRPVPQKPGSVFGDGSRRLTPIIGVVSKAKGKSVRTRFGIERYEEMIFIYIPRQLGIIPGQVPQQPNPNQTPVVNDANGDGIDDSVKPAENTPKP